MEKGEHPWWWMDGRYFYLAYTEGETRAYSVKPDDSSLQRYKSVATIWYNGEPVPAEEFFKNCPLFDPDLPVERR